MAHGLAVLHDSNNARLWTMSMTTQHGESKDTHLDHMPPLLVDLFLRIFSLFIALHLTRHLHDLDLCEGTRKTVVEGECVVWTDFSSLGVLREDTEFTAGE